MSLLPIDNQRNLFDKLVGGTLGALYGAKTGDWLGGLAGGYYGYKTPNGLFDKITGKIFAPPVNQNNGGLNNEFIK